MADWIKAEGNTRTIITFCCQFADEIITMILEAPINEEATADYR